jgi:ankyrin repeat protein
MSEVSFSDSLNRFKESFLWAAAQGGNTEDCESLLEIGAEVDWRNVDGDTALLAACRRGHADTIVLLLVYGASPNVKGKDLLTPLHICARSGDIKTLNVLLDVGADTSILTADSQSALDIARHKGHDNIVRRLSGGGDSPGMPVVNVEDSPEPVRRPSSVTAAPEAVSP